MSRRVPGLVLADWRARLLRDHPRLFPDARLIQAAEGPSLSASGWPMVEDGWRAVLEIACRRLEAILAAEPGAEVVVLDVKEKWGSLRLDVSSLGLSEDGWAAVALAVDLAEARSAHVCERCGAPGRLVERGGWIATRCAAHAEDHVPLRGPDLGLQVLTRFVTGRAIRTARRYDPVADAFVPAPLPPDDAE